VCVCVCVCVCKLDEPHDEPQIVECTFHYRRCSEHTVGLPRFCDEGADSFSVAGSRTPYKRYEQKDTASCVINKCYDILGLY